MRDNQSNLKAAALRDYALSLTDGRCAQCGDEVGADAQVVTNGGPWVAYCNEQHYREHRGTPVLTIVLNDA